MGAGMAANILVRGFDLTSGIARARRWMSLSGRVPASRNHLLIVAAASGIVLICVTDENAVHEVLFGPQGVVEGALPETLIIDMSTIAPQASAGHAEKLAAHGLSMLDAPVSGSKEGAEQGTLSIMVGGAQSEFERAYPVFQAMASTIVHVGERCGDGQTVKAGESVARLGKHPGNV